MNTVKDNWYETFFQGINCELWEKAVSPEWTVKETDFLVGGLNVKQGQRLLDIPCGFGRHSIELANRGYKLTGVDISETFLQHLNNKIKSESLAIEAIQGDILTMNLKGVYAGAFCLGNSFGYFNFDSMHIFVEKVSACLETGARFIINSGMVAESILPNFSKNKSFTAGNITMDVENIYDAENSCMSSVLRYTKEGRTEEHMFKHYVFTLGEIKRLLKLYGLKTIGTYSSTDKKEYSLGDGQVYIVAQKNKPMANGS